METVRGAVGSVIRSHETCVRNQGPASVASPCPVVLHKCVLSQYTPGTDVTTHTLQGFFRILSLSYVIRDVMVAIH